jgi:hypothetical protein
MRRILLGGVVGLVLAHIIGIVESGLIGFVLPWHDAALWRESSREWRNFCALAIAFGAAVGIVWVWLGTRGQAPDAPGAGRLHERILWKVAIGAVLPLAIVGASLVITPVRYAAVAWCRGENVYHGLPASFWVHDLKTACQPLKQVPRDAEGLPAALFGGNAIKGLTKFIAEDVKKDAVPDLIELLHDSNPTVRMVAGRALREIGPDAADATPALIGAATNDQQPQVRLTAALALVEIGRDAQPAVPVLVDALKDGQWNSLAADALGKLGPKAKDAVPVLIELTRKNPGNTGPLALEVLKKIDPEAAAKTAVK